MAKRKKKTDCRRWIYIDRGSGASASWVGLCFFMGWRFPCLYLVVSGLLFPCLLAAALLFFGLLVHGRV